LAIILNSWRWQRVAGQMRRWWASSQQDKQHWAPASIALDFGPNDIPRRGDRRKAFEAGVKGDLSMAVGCTIGRIKGLLIAEGGQPRRVSFKFGSPLLNGDRTANELKGILMAQVMDSSSSLYKGSITCHTDRSATLKELGDDLLARSASSMNGSTMQSDISASSPQAAIEQARARRRAQNLLNSPNPAAQPAVASPAVKGTAKSALHLAADIAAKEHERLTSISMGIKQYNKISQFYTTATFTRLIGRWQLHVNQSKAQAREEALLNLNNAGGSREEQLQTTINTKESEIAQLQQQLAAAQSTIQEQQAKLAENALVALERTELQSELRSTAGQGAELVGDISSKLSEVVIALQSQGMLFKHKLDVQDQQ